jgi:hypothetical protein
MQSTNYTITKYNIEVKRMFFYLLDDMILLILNYFINFIKGNIQ